MARSTSYAFLLGTTLALSQQSLAQTSPGTPRQWLLPASLTDEIPIPADICSKQDKLDNEQAQYRSAWFTRCGHLSSSSSKFLTMRINQDTLDWERIPAGSYNYPVFLGNGKIWKPDTSSCDIPLQVSWAHVCNSVYATQTIRAGNEIIYDGETKLFANAQSWDTNDSTITESVLSPAAGQKHLRLILNNENYWGAAAYAFKNWAHRDLAIYRSFTFKAKSPSKSPLVMKVFFVSMDGHVESEVAEVTLNNQYQKFELDLAALKTSSFDFSDVQGIVFAVSEQATRQFIIDLDDLRIFL
jgi:hypothetical protein